MSSAAVGEALVIDPAVIRFRVSPVHDLRGIVDGTWDQDRTHPIETTVKHKAIFERYRDGKPWEETRLFTDIYRRRFRAGGQVRGAATFKELVAQYYDRVDGMAESMCSHGFLTHREDGEPYPLPGLLIGRGGEVFIGNQGNHRVAIAQVFQIPEITGKIVCKHALA